MIRLPNLERSHLLLLSIPIAIAIIVGANSPIFTFGTGWAKPDESTHHRKLSRKSDGVNSIFSKNGEPTALERQEGLVALQTWKDTCRKSKEIRPKDTPIDYKGFSNRAMKRHQLVDSIIAGRILDNLSKSQIEDYLGPPDAPYALPGTLSYASLNGESQCDLCINLNDEKVEKVYLDVNY